jgi:hypothetical protein
MLQWKYVTPTSKRSHLPDVMYVPRVRDEDGKIEVQTSFYFPKHKYGDFQWVDPNEVTTFHVRRKDDKSILGRIIDHYETNAENQSFRVWWNDLHGKTMENLENLEILPDDRPLDSENIKPGARNWAHMRAASSQGTLAHIPLPESVQRNIRGFLTGIPGKVPLEKTNVVLREHLSRPLKAPGMGVAEQRRIYPENYFPALDSAPLPHGPSEENFLGGSIEMARRGTRKSRNFGLFSRLYSPVGHLLAAGKESVGAVANTAKGVVGEGITGLDKIGRSVSGHANMAVRDLLKRKSRKGGKRKGSRKTRKSRKTTRRRR